MYNILVKKNNSKDYSFSHQMLDISSRNQGIGPLLVLCITLKLLNERKLNLDDKVEITDTALNEKGKGVISYKKNDDLNLLQVLQNFKVTSGTDSLFLLCSHIYNKTNRKISTHYEEVKKTLSLKDNVAINISGKKNTRYFQNYCGEDVIKIANYILLFNPYYLDALGYSKIAYNLKIYQANTFLLDKGIVRYMFSFFDTSIYWIGSGNDFKIIVIDGLTNQFSLDSMVERILLKKTYLTNGDIDIYLENENALINIIGDTYLGEYYSVRRKKRNMFDPLLDKGYDYSFENLNGFLAQADLNIANHEACFINDNIKSPLTGMKKFILGANDRPSIAALKKANIQCLSLANNHTEDFGESGTLHTLEVLEKNNIKYFGVGKDEIEACRPLRIKVKDKVFSIFSGYWHRATNQKIFNFYATPSKPGVATLEGVFVEAIQQEKIIYPEHYIIIIPHWGIDFLEVKPLQRILANNLINAGADLIIGHGAHTLQDIKNINHKPVLFSIGNGFFNSDGEYDGYPNALPFGMIVQLVVDREALKLKLFPIQANNRDTLWQPNFVSKEEFKQVCIFYDEFNFNKINLDVWPYFFEILI